MPDAQTYRLIAHRGPKMCITEIKSFNWGGEPGFLNHALALAVDKAHKQNYVAAQFLFIEDEHLKHVASFVGVGPVWLYGEWHRTQYPDLYGMPLPRNPAEVRRYTEREAEESPKQRRRLRKRLRVDSSEDNDSEQPDDAQAVADPDPAPPVHTRPRTRARGALQRRSEEPELYLPTLDNIPWSVPDHIEEIFSRGRPGEIVRPKKRGPGPLPYLYVLDLDGRTYEAFDAITERIRGWHTDEECHQDYRITFDEDPYAGGSCPGTTFSAYHG